MHLFKISTQKEIKFKNKIKTSSFFKYGLNYMYIITVAMKLKFCRIWKSTITFKIAIDYIFIIVEVIPVSPARSNSVALIAEGRAALDGADDTVSNAQQILDMIDAPEKLRFVLHDE